MAGSFSHVMMGWSLIENMGDANEVVEELMWLVLSEIGEDRAKALLHERFYPMLEGEIAQDDALTRVHTIMGA